MKKNRTLLNNIARRIRNRVRRIRRRIRNCNTRLILHWIGNVMFAASICLCVWIGLSILSFVFHDPLNPHVYDWNFFRILLIISGREV